jgi:simple sugar transport system substrate-binding protein
MPSARWTPARSPVERTDVKDGTQKANNVEWEELMHLTNWLGSAAIIAALAFAASPAGAITIGFSQVGDEGDWRPAFSKDMQEEAKKEGIDLKFADAQGKEEEQLKAVRAFIAQKVDAIIIAPVVVTGWDQVLKEAKAAGIPVFLADRDVDVADKSLYVTRISADFNLEGRLAGAWLAQASKGSCNIVELQGTTGSAPAIERKKGFEAVIANFPNMKIIKTQSGDFTTEGGKKVMEAYIKSTENLKDVCASFAHNDNMQLGAIQAMKEAGLKPGKDFLMVSVDYVPAMKDALGAGDANASVELRSAIGKYIYPVVLQYLKDKKELPKWVVIPSDLHTAANSGG